MVGLDRWVIEQSLRAIAESSLGTVAINLSGATVTDIDLARHIEQQTRRFGVDASQLVFEITETAAIANLHSARQCLSSLSGIGCRIALDDFGAGFGSFHHLKHLQLDYIKIDGEFVRNLPASKTDQLLISAIVNIAHGLHQHTIAEHIEDAETLQILRRLDVGYAPGQPHRRTIADHPSRQVIPAAHDGRPTPERGLKPLSRGCDNALAPPDRGAGTVLVRTQCGH